MSESYLDRPQDDNTPKAHPAWKRGFKQGQRAGVTAMLKIVKDIIDGKDNGSGYNNTPEIEAVRRAVLEYRAVLGEKSIDSKKAKKALKDTKNIVAKVNL